MSRPISMWFNTFWKNMGLNEGDEGGMGSGNHRWPWQGLMGQLKCSRDSTVSAMERREIRMEGYVT
jgi:hypothetical protein